MFTVVVVCLLAGMASVASASSSDVLGRYRDLTLGDSVPTVVERLKVEAGDVKVLYDAPTLIQQLTWKPHRFVSGTTVSTDPLAELVLTFHSGRLARIVALYDRELTAGLTNADLIELLSSAYGTALLPTAAPSSLNPENVIAARQAISTWADAASEVVLWREEYPRRVGLTITATAADRALQQALRDGAALATSTEPQRERDRVAVAAAELKAREAQIRLANKAKFKP
jgi:hypothetical protein